MTGIRAGVRRVQDSDAPSPRRASCTPGCVPALPLGTLRHHQALPPDARRPGIASQPLLQLSLHPADLAVDDPAVPEALPEVPHPAGVTVEEAALEDIADAEVEQRAQIGRPAVVGFLLGLEADLATVERQRVLRLALRVAAVLRAPPVHTVQVVVVERAVEIDGVSACEHDVLVHLALFAMPRARAPDAQQTDSHGGVVDLAAAEPTLEFKIQSRDVVGQVRQLRLQSFDRLQRQVLVGVEAEHPLRIDRTVLQRPVKLFRVQSRPCMEHDRRAKAFRDLSRPVRWLRLDHEHLPRLKRRKPLHTPLHVELFLSNEDDDGDVGHGWLEC